ncbi:hypothetical protein [Bhargavaea cecembensis]|uniref:hypothetical protein n=1 Tax=Bhargavaea cecembensis TaxID=394098 RepID=UPI00084115D8|nr:hypothetical protein [Bhargavaea cecembensis]
MMLYKKAGNKTEFWEVWKNGRTLMIHHGTVGSDGVTEEVKPGSVQSSGRLMNQLTEEQMRNGFELVDEDGLHEFVVQFSYEDGDMQAALDKRQIAEDELDERLNRTGIGYCDGGDIGSGTANTFFYVIDVDKALQVVTDELAKHGLLEEAAIACATPDGDDYLSLHPAGAEFRLMDIEDEE